MRRVYKNERVGWGGEGLNATAGYPFFYRGAFFFTLFEYRFFFFSFYRVDVFFVLTSHYTERERAVFICARVAPADEPVKTGEVGEVRVGRLHQVVYVLEKKRVPVDLFIISPPFFSLSVMTR